MSHDTIDRQSALDSFPPPSPASPQTPAGPGRDPAASGCALPAAGAGPRLDLSVAIIARNNALTIRRTLASVRTIAREIVVVDSGSTDQTVEIARDEFGARIIDQPWLGHIRQKQFALEACTASWVLSLDSDESIEPELAAAIRSVVPVAGDEHAVAAATRPIGTVSVADPGAGTVAITGYEMNRRLFMAGRWLRHAFQPEWRLRLVRRGSARWGGYDPHDQLELTHGRMARLPGLLRHDAFTSVAELVRKQSAHGLRAAESYHAMGRRGSVGKLLLSPGAAVLKQLVLRQGFRDGWPGVAVSMGAGLSATVKHLALLELTMAPEQAEGSPIPPTIPRVHAAKAGGDGPTRTRADRGAAPGETATTVAEKR